MISPPGPPMTLANMRQNGVRFIKATCEACHHKADVNVDSLPATMTVPATARRMRCAQCGSKRVSVMPAWHTAPPREGGPFFRKP